MTQYRWNFEDDQIREVQQPADLFAPVVEQFGLKGWKKISGPNRFVQAYVNEHRMMLLTEAESGQHARDKMMSYVQYCIREFDRTVVDISRHARG